ncbi:MAG: DNA polymerase IV [Erysipelotrichales bacterium]|nr:DNA polymerase IV [Erysipelotrichales bacterium]
MSKIIMHIDLNAFFATAETIMHPEYEGKPIVVGRAGRRGIVTTASYEARKYGIHSAMPIYKAKELYPDLIIVPGHYELYERLSSEFFKYVTNYSPIIQIASIDECFVDMTEALRGVKNINEYLKNLQDGLYEKTKLKCSIGIAPTKFLAKMASDMKKPMGITIIRRKDIPNMIYPLPIESMFGIGKKTAPRLRNIGIVKIGDLKKANQLELKKILGKFYYTCMDWLDGKGSDIVETEEADPKSIGNSRTFEHNTDNYEEINKMIKHLCKMVSARAKEEEKLGTTVQVTVKTTDFKLHTKSLTRPKAFNSYEILQEVAIQIYDKMNVNEPIRLIGVTLQNLESIHDINYQMSLFDYQNHEEEAKTKLIINDLNRKMKKDVFKRASDVKK